MGWRDRDYAKFNDDERRALLGGGRGQRLPPSEEGLAHPGFALRPRVSRPIRRSRQHTSPAVLLAAAVSLAAVIFTGYATNVPLLHDLLTPSLSRVRAPHVVAPPTGPTPSAGVVAPPTNLVGIHWRPQDVARAANAGRICVTATGHGPICASYVVGERPADNLTRELERRGLKVQSTG
jgi:hypothetical protein